MVLELGIVRHIPISSCLALVLAASWACSSGSTHSSARTEDDAVAAAVQRVQRGADEPRPIATSGTTDTAQTRTEQDLLGDKQIPANAYYGVHRARVERAPEGRLLGHRTARRPEHVAVDQRQLPDGD